MLSFKPEALKTKNLNPKILVLVALSAISFVYDTLN